MTPGAVESFFHTIDFDAKDLISVKNKNFPD
jgi:hypothetical protein